MEDASDLPSGWQEYRTAEGAVYYHHAALGITQWAKPLKNGGVADTLGDSTMLSTPSFLTGQISESASHPDLEAQTKIDPALSALTAYQSEARRYFDVNTNDIKERLILASLPYRLFSREADNATNVTPFCLKPDMYGPIWIAVTVGFACFAGGHMYAWTSLGPCIADYETLCVSMTMTFLWLLLVPFAVRITSVSYGMSPELFRYDQLACVYGYSLLPIVPMSIVAALPSKLLQIIFVMAAFGVSCIFIGANFQRDFMSLISKRAKVAILSVFTGCHALLFLLMPVYFFALSTN